MMIRCPHVFCPHPTHTEGLGKSPFVTVHQTALKQSKWGQAQLLASLSSAIFLPNVGYQEADTLRNQQLLVSANIVALVLLSNGNGYEQCPCKADIIVSGGRRPRGSRRRVGAGTAATGSGMEASCATAPNTTLYTIHSCATALYVQYSCATAPNTTLYIILNTALCKKPKTTQDSYMHNTIHITHVLAYWNLHHSTAKAVCTV